MDPDPKHCLKTILLVHTFKVLHICSRVELNTFVGDSEWLRSYERTCTTVYVRLTSLFSYCYYLGRPQEKHVILINWTFFFITFIFYEGIPVFTLSEQIQIF